MFRPTPLSLLVLLLILGAQVIFLSSQIESSILGDAESKQTVLSLGVGSPVQIVTAAGKTERHIRWASLALNLGINWMVAAIVSRGLTTVTRLPRPARTYGFVVIAGVGFAFLIAITISKVYWGYWFKPPAFLEEVNDISRVQAIVFFRMERGAQKPEILLDEAYPLSKHLAGARKYSEEALSGRVLLELDRRNLLPSHETKSLAGLPELSSTIQSSGLLERSSRGYNSSAGLHGVAVDALGKSPGERLVFLGVQGGQLSNDHYPYYELLYRGKSDASSSLTFVRGQRYFYDAAGMEGFDWNVIWIFLTIPATVVGFVAFTLVKVLWKKPAVATAIV